VSFGSIWIIYEGFAKVCEIFSRVCVLRRFVMVLGGFVRVLRGFCECFARVLGGFCDLIFADNCVIFIAQGDSLVFKILKHLNP